jgi:hypothetical protein
MAGALVSVALAVGAADRASAEVTTVTAGDLDARLSWTPDSLVARDLRLQVLRAGQEIGEGPVAPPPCADGCRPGGATGEGSPVRVLDLDGDGQREVLVELHSGGNHCCTVAEVWTLTPTAALPGAFFDFGNVGFQLRDVDADGVAEFVTTDDRFAYRYAFWLASSLPVRVLSYRAGRFRDVTSASPDLVRADQRRWWRQYRLAQMFQRSPIAAWAANGYRLGERTRTLTILRREARRGRLDEGRSSGWRFVRRLDRDLRRLGYG